VTNHPGYRNLVYRCVNHDSEDRPAAGLVLVTLRPSSSSRMGDHVLVALCEPCLRGHDPQALEAAVRESGWRPELQCMPDQPEET
jgi:hypothetical protein